ncbi:site-specific DNA-methyltransferase [Chryseobacterium indologenes]|uniref:DNA methyltransferase n=1 Tax=Chryseobacterium indologenes TaxID=253 RepID=UPI0003E07CBD|nr:site-specific DNA-methyltransferase [Chryseobacterium indologenes]QPQ50675.1 site-specific DNA-methyltransferase [Chryseobacterium indologenes]GAE63163.1 putative methyltransferase [Chryseobacterium indologenes NBRC 14944]SFJ24333.1 adenine-specific DNA-methyltransferase [Chryseobacterium indologenes]SUX53376.1 Modification methylase MboII [Chryseobacterium indologenes]
MKLYQTLEKQIKKEPNYISDNGEIKKWVVLNKAQNFDEELIGLLLEDPDLKAKFFIQVKEVWVFKQNLFIQFLEQKNYLNDSYTQFKNKVGLTIDGKHLKQRNEVSLVWPFKDCILEGGQSREEDKREEIFFNEVLAQDEITELLDPKVLTNTKRFDKDGEHHFARFNRNEKGTITDNLIIKGNNLLALHSLKKEFAGKVKLIYIDPPYNTGNDGFKYNDSFNHSTWLSFMKNRLSVARELLRNDGLVFVQCDDNEQAYLKVLMDEIFARENFVSNIVWKGRGGRQDSKFIAQIHETIICFSKNISNLKLFKTTVEDTSTYSLKDEKGNYKTQLIRKWGSNSRRADRPNLYYGIEFENEIIFPILPDGTDGCWRWSKAKLRNSIENGEVILIEKEGRKELYEKIREKDGTKQIVFNSWIDESFSGQGAKTIQDIFRIKVFDYPKPEQLIAKLIEISTQENDIILDYHLGSGTTASTAHKMNLQYIGIEQMDYIETVAVERLKKVIDGEQGGISKSVNWQGGGSFIYLELKKYNQTFIEKIEEAKDAKTLLQIWEEMKEKSFLNYNIDIQKQEEYIEDFKTLSLQEQKQHLCELLDKNQLYVNLSSLKDGNFACTPEEQRVTREFYQLKN